MIAPEEVVDEVDALWRRRVPRMIARRAKNSKGENAESSA
jgi:hypothetical protein